MTSSGRALPGAASIPKNCGRIMSEKNIFLKKFIFLFDKDSGIWDIMTYKNERKKNGIK